MRPVTPCALCGGDVAQHGTTLEADLLIEERTFKMSPAFCSWQHAAAWFNQDPPGVEHWRRVGKPKRQQGPADGGLVTWIILATLLTLLLSAVVCLIVFLP